MMLVNVALSRKTGLVATEAQPLLTDIGPRIGLFVALLLATLPFEPLPMTFLNQHRLNCRVRGPTSLPSLGLPC
jgi:hypothetical protein